MQEAFGGTFMLKLFMVFFIIYVAFIGVALNFAKIYRIKNNVINILEQNQYSYNSNNRSIHAQLESYLDKVPYGSKNYFLLNNNFKSKCKDGDETFKDLGICVVQKGDSNRPYYAVTVYYVVDFPISIITLDSDLVITASGETIVIS